MAEKSFVGLPQELSAVAIVMGNCSTQLNALAQAIVRPDLNEADQRPTTVNACRLAHDMLGVLLDKLEPKRKVKASKKAKVQDNEPTKGTGT